MWMNEKIELIRPSSSQNFEKFDRIKILGRTKELIED